MEVVLEHRCEPEGMLSGISFWNRLLVVATFLFILAVPLIYGYMKKRIVRPLNYLNEGFYQIENGNRHYTVETEADTREFQNAYASFNRMVRSMESLRLDNMEKRIRKERAGIRQSEIADPAAFLDEHLQFDVLSPAFTGRG